MNPENPGINPPKSERPEGAEPKVILPTAEEIMVQVEGGLDEKAAEMAVVEKEYLQLTIDQVGREQDELKGGIFSKLSEKVRKAALVGFAGLSLFAASGSFSNAEAGDRSFAGKMVRQIEAGVLNQVRGGFQRGEREADWQQQMSQQIEMQEYYNRRNDEQMARQMEYQRRQQRDNERIQQERQREMAIQQEVRRYADDIARAKSSEEMATAKEKHNVIMEELRNI